MSDDGARTTADGDRTTTDLSRRGYLARSGLLAASAATATSLAGCSGGGGGGGGGSGGGGSGSGGSTEADTATETEASGTTAGSSGDYDPVGFIETPGNRPDDMREQWEPFVEYLQSEVSGLEMNIQVAQSYSAAGQALLNDQAAITSGDVVLLANPNDFDVMGIRETNGSQVYFSFVVTLQEYEDINELTDLEGETIAFADRLSTSGSLFATFALKQAGLDIGGAPYGEPEDYTGQWSDHDTAKQQLFNRDEVVAQGTYGDNIIDHIPLDQFPERVEERSSAYEDRAALDAPKEPVCDLLHVSSPIPSSPIITASDWEHPLRPEIQEAIVNIEPGTLREPDGDVDAPITAVGPGTVDDYEPVRKVIEELGVDFGDL